MSSSDQTMQSGAGSRGQGAGLGRSPEGSIVADRRDLLAPCSLLLAPRRAAPAPRRFAPQRGSALLTVMLLATALALGLAAQLALARNSMLSAQRAFYQREALGLAEAGLEEALDCFNLVNAGTTATTAWAAWTRTATTATRTLAPFDRDGRAVATVKIHVTGWDGSTNNATVISQARMVPFDGSAPLSRVVQISLQKTSGYFIRALVAREGMNLSGQASADSFNSNPTGNPAGPWLRYSEAIARANTQVIVPSGSITLGSQCTISGNLALGSTVAPPPASKVSGTITTNFTGSFPLPIYPSAMAVSQSYDLGSTVPSTLPVTGHQPAADGRYYYFVRNANIANVSITAGRAVTIVGTTTTMGAGIGLTATSSLSVYIDGVVNCGNNAISNSNWSGALQIFTSTTGTCTIGGNGNIYACFYAPNAVLNCSGGGSTGMLVGSYVARTISSSGHMDFHYDEALQAPQLAGGTPWAVTSWYERRSATDRAALAGLTGNFLP
jgi:hypothetical protein